MHGTPERRNAARSRHADAAQALKRQAAHDEVAVFQVQE